MIAVKKSEVLPSVIFQELWLAIDSAVMVSKESIDEFAFCRCDAFEAMFFYFSELGNHLFVNFEVLGSILTWIPEGLAPHAHEGEQTCHVEGGIDEDAKLPPELLCIHRSHRGGNDEIRLNFCDLLAKERKCFCRHHWYIRCQDLNAAGVESIAHTGSCACGTAAGKAVDI